jgi:5-deoxy-glucuronate isomerase
MKPSCPISVLQTDRPEVSNLLIRPHQPEASRRVLHVTPASAGWTYVGFDLYHLRPGDAVAEITADREVVLVLIDGKAEITAGKQNFGTLGQRMSVFEKTRPWSVYVPNASDWSARAATACTLAVCSAPGRGGHKARVIAPEDITPVTRGKGANTRHVHPIAMEDADIADSLLVVEVYTPDGNWSSYPSHRHDEDDFPAITLLEETYYHRLNPPQGFGFHRVYTEDGSLDEVMTVRDGDVVLVPRGHHPYGSAYGYETYYLNVMAGPLRKWRFKNDPAHDWIARRDA